MIKIWALCFGLAALVVSVLFSPYQYDYSIKIASAQSDDLLFKECRDLLLNAGNRMSEAMDRAPYEDMRTEVHAIMTGLLAVQSDCEPVKDRLIQDPALKYQNEYFMERAKEFGYEPSELSALGNATNATSGANVSSASVAVMVAIPIGSSNGGQGYQPSQVTTTSGSTVIWHNQDSTVHSATSGNPDPPTPDGNFDTGYIGEFGSLSSATMPTEPGEYTYFCTIHPFLVGKVTVR